MTEENKKRRQEIYDRLKTVGILIHETFGDLCEVVLHDLSKPDNSIIWMEGNVTGRSVGGPISDFGLATFTSGDYSPKYGYTTFTDDGKVLKSSTLFVRDDDGTPFGAMCINFDISSLLAFEGALSTLISRNETLDIQETFCADITGTLNLLLMQALGEMGKPIEMLNVSDRSELIQILDEMGAFHLKKAVPFVAGKLGVSRQTIYNYLKHGNNSE